MLAKRIIPCLDVNNGRVVKGVNFVNLRDAGDPVEIATFYSQQGADEIVFLDITATYENRQTIADVVRRPAQQVFVPLTVGGGIRTSDDFKELLRAGADKISVNSAAVWEIIIIRIIPCKRNIGILACLADSLRPLLIKRIVAIHNVDSSMWSAKFS